jgi:putative membrane protein
MLQGRPHPPRVSGGGRCSGKNLTVLGRLAIRLIVLAVIIGIVAAIVPGIQVHGGFVWLLWIAVIFSLINLILGPILHLLSLPLIILTLGLFLLIINAAMLAITAGLTKHLDVDNFGSAVLGGLLIAVFSWLAELLLPVRAKKSGSTRT